MRTMVDEIFDRTYQGGRNQLHRGFGQALETVRSSVVGTYRIFQAIQFDAPWSPRSREAGCA